jgi:predicted AAA+ superfamily ATPase
MLKRDLEPLLHASLRRFPVAALVGPRQVGKTTLARTVARKLGRAVYLDLERPSDAAKLTDPELYLDTLEDTFMIRQLPPFAANLKKRLVKSPKVYLRDSGLLHALLRIGSMDDLLGHPIAGASWEGWVIEQAIAAGGSSADASFFRTAAGAEIDLVLERPRGKRIALEIKLSSAPKPTRGFWSGIADLKPSAAYVVYPGTERYPLGQGVEALPLSMLGDVLRNY